MAEFKKLPTQAELQQMLYMGQLQGKSTQDIINENLARGTTIKALPESFFTTAGAGARQAGQFVNQAGTAQDLAKLFPGYTGKATIPIPTRFNFAAKMDPYSGQAIPGGLQTQQIPYGDILKAIKPADVLGLTGTQQAYSDIGAGKVPSPMDVLDVAGLGAATVKPAQLGFKASKGLLEATKGLPVGMSIQDVSKAGQQLPAVPETMYHGTASDIQAFRPGNTVYVTPSPKFAESYAGTQSPNIMPLRADVTKPFNYENAADIEKLANTYKKIHGEDLFAKKTISSAGGEMKLSQLDKNPISQRLKSGDWTLIEDKKVQEAIKKAGFDAFYIEEGGVKNLGVYDPTKLKSVFSPSVNPPGLLGSENKFNIVKRDASDIFGAGSEKIRYIDPKSGGSIEVLVRPNYPASIVSLEVPEAFRGKKIGESLQAQVLQDFPAMQGQVSSKAAAKTAYRLGRRPADNPNASLDDVFKAIDEYSSVNMVSPQTRKQIKK